MVKTAKKLTIDQKLDALIKMFKTDSTKKDQQIDRLERIAQDHTANLKGHTGILKNHEAILKDHTGRLTTIEHLVDSLANFTYDYAQKSDDKFKLLIEQGELNRADIQDLKSMVSQLVRNEAHRDRFEIDTDKRLTKIEKHLKFA